jgi:hypothetical protein
MFDWSGTVYLLCIFASVACAAYLAQAYVRRRQRVLFWSAAGFFLFAVANGIEAIEALTEPNVDLYLYRALATLGALALVLYGFMPEKA